MSMSMSCEPSCPPHAHVQVTLRYRMSASRIGECSGAPVHPGPTDLVATLSMMQYFVVYNSTPYGVLCQRMVAKANAEVVFDMSTGADGSPMPKVRAAV